LVSLLSVIVLLGVLIFIHEFGHFLTAKLGGVGVLKFSLGFGPAVVGKKIGETEYMLSLVPLGGYVKLLGEAEEEELTDEERKRSFTAQPVWKRMAIVVAGPIFNILLAILIFTFVYSWGIPVLKPKIGEILPESAAFQAGLQKTDLVTAINGKEINRWNEMAELINESKGNILQLKVKRAEQILDIKVKPTLLKGKNIFGEEVGSYKIGITPAGETTTERHPPLGALGEAFKQTWVVTKLTLLSIVKILEGVISPRTLGGPIMIAQLAGAQVKEGMIPFILFMALLSINLAVLNLLPIPVLDGGHLLFYLIEIIRGKEVNLKWRERAQQVGFVLLILLMVFVVLVDLERLNLKFIQEISNFFSK